MGRAGSRGPGVVLCHLRDECEAVLLYPLLALLRTAADSVDIPQRRPDELAGTEPAQGHVASVLRRVGAAAPPRPPSPLARGPAMA